MGRLFRPTIIRYVDRDGKRCRKSDPGARKKSAKSRVWRGEYRDADGLLQTQSLGRNKQAARQMLAELERRVEFEKAGLTSPLEEPANRPLAEHIADYRATLMARGRTEDHCHQVVKRIERVMNDCGFQLIGQISASRVEKWLADQKQSGELSEQTVRHYCQSLKQFTRWLVADRRTADDRLAHLEIDRGRKVEQTFERRELTDDELERLFDATLAGPHRSLLTGRQRHMLYLAGMSTGFRASELSSLTPESFDLEAETPTVSIAAKNEKARRGATLPLPPDFVTIIRPWLAQIDSGSRLWPGKWASQKRAGKILKADMQAARQQWIDEADTDAERDRREQSEFLQHETSEGRADFHALRHTFLSRLGRTGATPKVMQMMARHSTVAITLERYTHASRADLSSAAAALPALPTRSRRDDLRNNPQTAAEPESLVAGLVAGPDGNHCESMRTIEAESTSLESPTAGLERKEKPLHSQGFEADCSPLRTADQERRGWDSNPRCLAARRFSRPVHSATLPPLREPQSANSQPIL
jgi:integrase/recombinase XerD